MQQGLPLLHFQKGMVISLGWEAGSSHGCQVCYFFVQSHHMHRESCLFKGPQVYIDFPNHQKGNVLGARPHSSRESFHNVNWKLGPEQGLTTVMTLVYFPGLVSVFHFVFGHLPQVIKLCKNVHCNSLRLQQCTVLKHRTRAVHIRGTEPTMPSQQGPEAFPHHSVGNKTTGRNPIVFRFTLFVLCVPCIKERLTKEFCPFKRESGTTPETHKLLLC